MSIKGNYTMLGEKAFSIALKGGKFNPAAYAKYGFNKEAFRNLASEMFRIFSESSGKYSDTDASIIKDYLNEMYKYSTKGSGVSSKITKDSKELLKTTAETIKVLEKEENALDRISSLSKKIVGDWEESARIREEKSQKDAQWERVKNIAKQFVEQRDAEREYWTEYKRRLDEVGKQERMLRSSLVRWKEDWKSAGAGLTSIFEPVVENTKEEISLADRLKSSLGSAIKQVVNLSSKNRKLSFTQKLFDGITGALGKMVGYTKIMSGSIGLVTSAFGFLIDMIFLPLLPLMIAIAETLFSFGEGINSFMEMVQGIPIFGGVIAGVLSVAGLLAVAFAIFTGGTLLKNVDLVVGAFRRFYNILKDISLLQGLESVLSFLGFGKDKGKGTGDGTTPVPTGTGGKKPDTEKPKAPTKTPTKAPLVAGGLLAAGTSAIATIVGGAIVNEMSKAGINTEASEIGKELGIQDLIHGGKGYNILETGVHPLLQNVPNPLQIPSKMVSFFANLGNMTNAIQDFYTTYVDTESNPIVAITAESIERAINQGLYSDAVQNILDTKFGANTFRFVNASDEYEAGYYYFGAGNTPIGGRQTSMSSMVSSTSNVSYTTNYQNTNGNGAFVLSNVAGL